jgi:hypothetical protein
MVQKEQPTLYEEMEKLKLEIVEKGQLNKLRVKYTIERPDLASSEKMSRN